MTCDECGATARLHETDVSQGTKAHWCLDHAPERYSEDAARLHALDVCLAEWDEEMARRKATGETILTWRVPAASTFTAGWRASQDYHAGAHDFRHASGACVCKTCGKTYREHPHDEKELSHDDLPYLRVLCNGDRVKL